MKKIKLSKKSTREEVVTVVVRAFERHNIPTVLVGGSVVSIYTNNEYESKDLDFISPTDSKKIISIMSEIGFSKKGKDFHHPKCEFTVEFPGRTVAIGDLEPVHATGELCFAGTKITLLSPTQCIMDRLAWFYFSNDRQCLDQAVSVYKAQGANLIKIKSWSIQEGNQEKYEIFVKKIKKKKN